MDIMMMILTGVAVIAKVIIAMEEGIIPATLHVNKPHPEIPGLLDGHLKVVTHNTEWDGGYVGITSFGLGGTNVHTILHSNNTRKPQPHPAACTTRLFTHAAQTEEGLSHVLATMREHSHNVPMQALLQESSQMSLETHPYRGYTLLNSTDVVDQINVSLCLLLHVLILSIAQDLYLPWHVHQICIQLREERL